jgi:hypothetical protein
MAKTSEPRSNEPKKGAAPRRRPTTSRAQAKSDGDMPSPGATGADTARESMTVAADAPSHDKVAERAYQLYQSRGGEHGADLEDWLRAEEELRAHRRKAS